MQHNITSSLITCLSETGFSMDELVYRMDVLFKEKAYSDILKHILLLTEEVLRLKVMQKQSLPVSCSCGSNTFVLNGYQSRQIKTSLGTIKLQNTSRIKCVKCGKSYPLLLRFLGLESHQSKTSELEKLVLEQVAQTSYRRAAKNIRNQTGLSTTHTTFHNWALRTNADDIQVSKDVIGSVPGEIFADGTKCKSIGSDGKSKKGDIKVMIGVNAQGDIFPIGTWTHNESWQEISDELNAQKIKFPEGTVLVCDGEPGLAEALSSHAEFHQRCQWHLVRDTYHAMWEDGGRVKEIRPVQNALKSIFAVELPKEDFQKVTEAEKDQIEERMENAETYITRLINYLREKGYTKAAEYLQRSQSYMFNYVRRWLKFGISCPRASSLIERTMREIGRRVKKLAYNWKPDGLEKITKIVLKLFSQPEQ